MLSTNMQLAVDVMRPTLSHPLCSAATEPRQLWQSLQDLEEHPGVANAREPEAILRIAT